MPVRAHRSVVLVVDDEREVREYAAFVLRQHGLLVATAADAEAALEILSHVVVDALFTDIVMPGVDGLALADRARRLQPGLKVVCATGYVHLTDDTTLDVCERLLRKPYRPQQLTAEIDSVLAV